MRRSLLALLVLVLLVLAATACGDDDDDDATTTTTAAASTTTAGGSGGGSTTASTASAAQISHAQAALAGVGCYTGAVDGIYGPATASAIEAFQDGAGLTVDGVVGPATLAALDDAVAANETVCEAPADGGTSDSQVDSSTAS